MKKKKKKKKKKGFTKRNTLVFLFNESPDTLKFAKIERVKNLEQGSIGYFFGNKS